MSADKDFFGDVFDSPEDDPLLGDGAEAPNESSTPESREQGPPSWMSDDEQDNPASSRGNESGDTQHDDATAPTKQKEIVLEGESGGRGLDELNEAVGQGWRLVRISLVGAGGQQAASRREAERFVATLEQESPQSLFDFGA